MKKVTHTLQSLIFGDRSLFVMNRIKSAKTTINPSITEVAKVLYKLEKKGYTLNNPEAIMYISIDELALFKKDFIALIKNSTKSGKVLRTTFFDSEFPTDYTEAEWLATYAQYSITYGWDQSFTSTTGKNAQEVLQEYLLSASGKTVNLTKATDLKRVTIIQPTLDLSKILLNIISSKSVLRTHQIEILRNSPATLLAVIAQDAKMPIKETLVLVTKLIRSETEDLPTLKTAQDVLRYIVSVHAEEELDGQLSKSLLQTCKIHISTHERKQLLSTLETIAESKKSKDKGSKFLCEDMYIYESFWKTIHKYLQFEKYTKTREKYPLYTRAIDLLYDGDRSWTYNGRYSTAKEILDYAKAIEIAAERPGTLLRNMMEFMRMAKGTLIPKKKVFGKSDNDQLDRKVKTDASAFIKSDKFKDICANKLNTKLAFQLIEQIRDPGNNHAQYSRVVQGATINYINPVPALNTKMKQGVTTRIEGAIRTKLQAHNKGIQKIFIAADAKKYALQYSGHKSTEISYNGEFLARNSIIDFSELKNQAKLIRLGVMWRGRKEKEISMDIDHSVTLIKKNGNETMVYYPMQYATYKTAKKQIAAASSGDITSNGGYIDKFSTEIVDLDIDKLKADGIVSFYNSFIDYRGSYSIGSVECYVFMQLLPAGQAVTKQNSNNIRIDLAQTDYAIQIDPNNTDNTGAYIGLSFNLQKETIEVLALPVKTPDGKYSNARTTGPKFQAALANRVSSLELGYAIEKAFSKDQRTCTIDEATVVISRKERDELSLAQDVTLLHPGRDSEKINAMLYV